MVKTRHRGDDDEEEVVEFMSLPSGRPSRRRSQQAKTIIEESDDGSDDETDVDYHIGMKLNISKRRSASRQDKNTTRSGRIVEKPGRLSPELVANKRTSPVKQTRSRRKLVGVAHDSDDDVSDSDRKNPTNLVNGSIDSEPSLRRSTRHRRLLYDTFNQSLIDRIQSANSTFENGSFETSGDADKFHDNGEEKNTVFTRRRRSKLEVDVDDLPPDEVEMDMYSKVKRTRLRVKRDMYGIPIHDAESEDKSEEDEEESSCDETDNEGGDGEKKESKKGSDDGDSSSDEEEEEEEDEDEEEEDKNQRKQYYLREHKPRTQIFDAGPDIRYSRPKKFVDMLGPHSPVRRKHRPSKPHKSPARRSPSIKFRRRAAFHGSSSTSSSSSSSDEERFERRKKKSMARARNRCLPMNMDRDDVATGVIRERLKVGSSLADVDPMNVDRNVTFESVGGLGKHVRALKEMIVFPLMYPEVFERFKIQPPRGVLFYGPPGTGKTLVARALANECSQGDRKVAFFMRKGADCLSKWVGESERQLRLLFDQAYQMRPSIIFFDEIDGLAPVRSSRQDQIHSSIVSTLLALMDGLDTRGEIVVIGATNRIDSIDPALRRPGRFDREFLFPLPSLEARRQILKIHTRDWNPKLADAFISELAEKCVGYCGADVRALCTEAALFALRRRYPQIYTTNEKLQLDVTSININARDFHYGMQNIVPTAQRSVVSPGRALSIVIEPLLRSMFESSVEYLGRIFPSSLAQAKRLDTANGEKNEDLDLYSDDDDEELSIFDNPPRNRRRTHQDLPQGPFMNFMSQSYHRPATHRPRLLLAGEPGQGQSSHLAPAILHHLEQLPVHVLDLPSLYAVSAKTPEESCAQIFREARRTSPSIIYMPHVGHWWEVSTDTLRATFLTLLQDLEPSTPVLLLATSDEKYAHLSEQIHVLFEDYSGNVIHMKNSNSQARKEFFQDLFLNQATKPPSQKRKAATNALEVLPVAPPPEPRKLTEKESKRLFEQEESVLRELRLFLRDVINKLARDRKFAIFTKPVDVDEVEDYYEIIKSPMDLSSMMSKIDLHKYETAREFLADINLICTNALEYNPDHNPTDRAIRHRACALRDLAHSVINTDLDPEFEKQCEEIVASRKRRGETPSKTAPSYYHVKPFGSSAVQNLHFSSAPGLPGDYPSRFSRRIRGMETEETPEVLNSRPADNYSNTEAITETPRSGEPKVKRQRVEYHRSVRIVKISRAHFEKLKKKKSRTSPWCKPSAKNRRRFSRNVQYEIIDSDEDEEEDEEENEEKDEKGTVVEELPTEIQTRSLRSPAGSKPNSPLSPGARMSFQSSSPRCTRPHSPASAQSSTSPGRAAGRQQQTSGQELELISEHSYSKSPDRSPRLETSPHGLTEPLTIDVNSGNRNMPILVNEDSNKENDPDTVPMSPRGGGGDGDAHSGPSRKRKRSESHTSRSEADTEPVNLNAPVTPPRPTEGNNDSEGSSDTEITASPAMRLTRSRLHSQQQAKAQSILEEATPPLIVDKDALVTLLDRAVELTNSFTIERLEKIHCLLSQCVFNNRHNYDKTELIEALRMTLLKYTQTH